MSSPHIIVIGGGLAGLAASAALAAAGCRVSLFEKSPRLGGRATSYVLPDGEQIDNCQHVTLRCCTNLEDFYVRIGAEGKIAYYDALTFADSTGRRGVIRLSRLPAPFHLLPSFVTFPLLNWREKQSIARAMVRIVASGGHPDLLPSMSMLDWLKQANQTPLAIDLFWRTVLVSALNEELDRIDASYGVAVIWKVFLSNRNGFAMGIPSVPLAELYASSGERIGRSGGQVRTRSGVAELQISAERVTAARLDNGTVVDADHYIAALPFDRLLRILPESVRAAEPFFNLSKLEVSPITGVHLWFDRPVMQEPFITCVGQTIQWVFNKRDGCYLQIVISASHRLTQPQSEIIDLCKNELARLIPVVREAGLVRSIVVRETAATFSPLPGCDRWRPQPHTPVRNLLLAGDWIQTGWPATMESAVRSGYQAAEAILEMEGRPLKLVRPELPATGMLLARRVGRSARVHSRDKL